MVIAVISFDTNILIYYIEKNQEWFEAAKKVLKMGEDRGAIISELVRFEVLRGVAMKVPSVLDKTEQYLGELIGIKFAGIDAKTVSKAINITKQFDGSVTSFDALHIAHAITHGATEFWTNDQRLVSMGIDEIKICSL